MEFGTEMDVFLASIPFAFIMALLFATFLYWFGGKISAKGAPSSGKLASYACGEHLPSETLQVNLQSFFVYAVYFMIFDILAFMLATSLGAPGVLPAAYAAILLLAVVMLMPLTRRK